MRFYQEKQAAFAAITNSSELLEKSMGVVRMFERMRGCEKTSSQKITS